MTQNNDTARIMAVKSALVQTVNTAGWAYIRQIADAIVKKTIDEALDEEDHDKRDGKTLKASALRRGFSELWVAVDAAKSLELQTEDDNTLGELETETAVEL